MQGELVHGDESLIGVWAFKMANDIPAVRLTIVGGCDIDLTTEHAQYVAVRLWHAGRAASVGVCGHHVQWKVDRKDPVEISLGEDFRLIGVESFQGADGKPVVELLIRDIASARTQPQGAARVAARLLKAILIARLCDPLDPPEPVDPVTDDDLHEAAAIFAALDGLAVAALLGDKPVTPGSNG